MFLFKFEQEHVPRSFHFSPELQAELGCGEFGYALLREGDAKKDPMDGLDHGTHVAGIAAELYGWR